MEDVNGATLTATFATRRDADLVIERLVQEEKIERTNIFVAALGDENTAGFRASGADVESGHSGVEAEGSPALEGGIAISVDMMDKTKLSTIRGVFEEMGGEGIAAE
jgi:hypothetical protein